MKKRLWDKPKLLILVRPKSTDNVTVLQGCKFAGLQGPQFADCLSGPQGAICSELVAS